MADNWRQALQVDDLWEGEMTAVMIDGAQVLVVNIAGVFRAYSNECPHQASPLGEGVLEGARLTCARHLWEFNALTGLGVNPAGAQLKSYGCEARSDGAIYVDLGPMTTAYATTFSAELETVEPQLRLAESEAVTALASMLGQPVVTARARLRFGPGRTCESLARVLDRAIVRAEGAGFDPDSLVVVEGTAQAAEDIVRVRRLGYGTADWIHSPASSVRIVLRPAGLRSMTVAPASDQPLGPLAPGTPAAHSLSDAADERCGAVREALSEVIDPDLGVNIVDLGFVRGVAIEFGAACITMTLTSAACPLTAIIERQIRDALAELPSIDGFRIDWQWIPAWRPADMTDSGREQLRSIGFTI